MFLLAWVPRRLSREPVPRGPLFTDIPLRVGAPGSRRTPAG